MVRELFWSVGGRYLKMSAKVGRSEVAGDAESSGQESAYPYRRVQVQSWEGCSVRYRETGVLHECSSPSHHPRKRQESHH